MVSSDNGKILVTVNEWAIWDSITVLLEIADLAVGLVVGLVVDLVVGLVCVVLVLMVKVAVSHC